MASFNLIRCFLRCTGFKFDQKTRNWSLHSEIHLFNEKFWKSSIPEEFDPIWPTKRDLMQTSVKKMKILPMPVIRIFNWYADKIDLLKLLYYKKWTIWCMDLVFNVLF